MTRIRLILQYDGSAYHGFQKQENAYTVQECLENAILRLTGEKASIVCAGRTDAGVHALGQVVAFDSEATIPGERWKMAINTYLPDDIQVLQSCLARADFNPRFQAVSKQYTYFIYRRDVGRVIFRNYALCTQVPLDLKAMQEAAALMVGRRNFRAFCASGSSAKTFERSLMKCILEEKGLFITLKVEADGFLYNMVRIIMGTLMEIGQGKYPARKVEQILLSEDRTLAGPTAPPQGLYLRRVIYPD
ncbi:MAG: tRNA pseudouridine(38-40) synthase TruA [Syntrophomonas sp.]